MTLFSMRLFVGELRQLLSRPRLWLAVGVILAIGLANVAKTRDGFSGQVSWWVVLRYALSPVKVLLPVLVVGAVGTLIAEQRRSGFASLVLVRSVRPLAYLLSGLAASMVAAAVLVAVPLVVIGSLARAIAPPLGTVLYRIPAGFPSSPGLLSLAPAVIFAAGAIFVVTLASLTGLATTNLVGVVCVPAFVFIVGSSLPDRLSAWNPWTYLEIQPGGPTLLAIVAFWSVGALASLVISVAMILRRRAL